MKKVFNGKDVELATKSALEELQVSEKEVVVKVIDEGTKGILGFGSKKAEIQVVKISDVVEFGKNFISDVLDNMGVTEYSLETIKKDNFINYKLYSDNNGILIGKNGKTLSSLQFLLKQATQAAAGIYIGITLDIGGYKDKRKYQLEKLAYRISRTVAKTRVEAKLDPMNAYERRIIHTYLLDDKFVYTVSEGQDPERYIVIKPKEK
jgi:spoIIIJ-associated protein